MTKTLTVDPLRGEELVIHITPASPELKPVGARPRVAEVIAPMAIFDAPGGIQVMVAPIGRHLDIFEWRGEWAKVYPDPIAGDKSPLKLGGRMVAELWARIGRLVIAAE